MPEKNVQRMCVACRELKDKQLLLRMTRSPQGDVLTDFSGKKPGRGAYICISEVCLQKAKKNRAFERALRVRMEDTMWQQLREEICRRS